MPNAKAKKSKPRRTLHATIDLTTSPPDTLPNNHKIARVQKPAGNNLYAVLLPSPADAAAPQISNAERGFAPKDFSEALVELPPRFRNAIWLRRGTYVVVDVAAMELRENKLGGEIVNVVREEKAWRAMKWWPLEFSKQKSEDERDDGATDDSEEESTMGKMPPSESDGE